MVEWAGGNPQLLTGLAAELKRQGIVRKRDHGDGWYIGTAELERLPPAAERQWLAARALDDMTPELAACVRVCAVLGPAFARDELAWVQRAIDDYGGAGTTMDTDVGIAALVEHGVIRASDRGRFSFVQAAFRDAVYGLLAGSEREHIHAYAAAYWHLHVDGEPFQPFAHEHFARHAAASDRIREAAASFARLGDYALGRYRYTDADQHYSSAIRLLDGAESAVLARALAGRGSARYHIHRTQDAFDDLDAAHALCERLGDSAGAIRALLEGATAADAASDYDRADARVEAAGRALDQVDDEGVRALEPRWLLARGRTAYRRGHTQRAIELMSEAVDGARAIDDHETAIIALVLLGPALVREKRGAEAERAYEDAISLAEMVGDRLHQCAAYANRMTLWVSRQQTEAAVSDLRQLLRIARELGNPEPERVGTHNLAELLYWTGDFDEALSLARRSRTLQKRFWKGIPHDALLVARIHCAKGQFAAARELLDAIALECDVRQFEPMIGALHESIRLVLDQVVGPDADARAWDALIETARADLSGGERLEVFWWRAFAAIRAQRWDEARDALAEARDHLDEAPVWQDRVSHLADQLPRANAVD
jgi:tetratricopeptide (TPR) repeat protein